MRVGISNVELQHKNIGGQDKNVCSNCANQ